MFQTIVIGIDGRPADDEAYGLAQTLAEPGATFIVSNICGLGDGFLEAGTSDVAAAMLADSQTIVDRFVALHPGCEGIATSSRSFGEGLAHVAKGAGADLIVVASSRRGFPGRVLAGEAIWGALRHAPCPVAVSAVGHGSGKPLHSIVVGYDGSAASEVAVQHALRLSKRDDASVSAVEIVEPVVPVSAVPGVYTADGMEAEQEQARRNLTHLLEEHGLHGVVGIGRPAHELNEASVDADLLVVGFHDHGPLERFLIGSASRALLRHQAVPILFVPPAT